MCFAKFAVLALAPVALAAEQHRNTTAGGLGTMDLTPDLNTLILAPILALLRPLSLNAKTSKGIEEKFGPIIAKILRGQYQVQTALYQLGQCTGCHEFQMLDPELAKADESLPKVQPDDGTGGAAGGAASSAGGAASLPVPLPVPGLPL